MEICVAALPAGSRFYISDVGLRWATSIWHRNDGQHDVLWRDPFRSIAIRASQLEITTTFRSNQPSSVIFRRLRSGLYPASALGLRGTTGTSEEAAPQRDNSRPVLFVFAICVRSWPCDAIVMRGSWIFHLSLGAWLAASGLWMGWCNPPSLQSAITYEMTTVSHPVSHLPWSHTSQQRNHSREINERRWGVMGDSLIAPVHAIL